MDTLQLAVAGYPLESGSNHCILFCHCKTTIQATFSYAAGFEPCSWLWPFYFLGVNLTGVTAPEVFHLGRRYISAGEVIYCNGLQAVKECHLLFRHDEKEIVFFLEPFFFAIFFFLFVSFAQFLLNENISMI